MLAVPFRRPAMVAKLAASLDLLSGGRLILGLGGGYSDAEIAALGSPAPSPAEKVDGLAEAIQVIRGAWTQPGYSPGRARTTASATWRWSPGPAARSRSGSAPSGRARWPSPAGSPTAGSPRSATGPLEDFPAMRRRIDAARRSRRPAPPSRSAASSTWASASTPARRPQPDLVTGSAAQVLSQLRELLGLGFTGFNFLIGGPDRGAALRQVAEEVLPALRSAR